LHYLSIQIEICNHKTQFTQTLTNTCCTTILALEQSHCCNECTRL